MKESPIKRSFPQTLHGPNDSFSPEKSHLIPAIIRKIHEAKQNNEKSVEIWGNGEARREFLFVDDLAKFIEKAVHHFSEAT